MVVGVGVLLHRWWYMSVNGVFPHSTISTSISPKQMTAFSAGLATPVQICFTGFYIPVLDTFSLSLANMSCCIGGFVVVLGLL